MKRQGNQHRPESEETRRNKLHAETRRENIQLRREVTRLRRELEKLEEHQPVEDDAVSVPEPKAKAKGGCPECGAGVTEVKLPTGWLRVCRSCSWRKKS